MAHFDPEYTPDVSPADRAAIAHDFMKRCREWAVTVELPKRRQAVLDSDDPEAAAKLHQWLTWLAFTDHALGEIESGKLDPWFDGGTP
ncbi:MAG: hypothetical protein EP330_21885 [Deltaproteobacteria bacterium]|nr:MAG: hypothetical protein EP330_21885 [Deltaproteobacteria bacterium]